MENPDNKTYLGLGPQSKQVGSDGEELSLDSRYLVPSTGMLRFVERGVPTENAQQSFPRDENVLKRVRILQQYQWSTEAGFDWYDIPLVTE